MNLMLRFLLLAAGLTLYGGVAVGQITITASDVATFFAVGNGITQNEDTLTTAFNIGSPGSSSWDFSGLQSGLSTVATSVNPASTPYIGEFPGATHALQTTVEIEGIVGMAYQYLTLSTDLLSPGLMAGASTVIGPVTLKQSNVPPATVYSLPSTLGTTWTTTYTASQVISFGGTPISTESRDYAETYTVDAWGPLTVPGGGVVQALRIRAESRSPDLSVSYLFLAKEGYIFTVEAADTSSPASGTIPVTGVSWFAPLATDVASEAAQPTAFALYQNYPNPFNPTTEIRYSVPVRAAVSLRVYNAIGQEVAVLVDEVQEPGERVISFDASGLASGLYFYRLRAGSSVQTRSMVLMR